MMEMVVVVVVMTPSPCHKRRYRAMIMISIVNVANVAELSQLDSDVLWHNSATMTSFVDVIEQEAQLDTIPMVAVAKGNIRGAIVLPWARLSVTHLGAKVNLSSAKLSINFFSFFRVFFFFLAPFTGFGRLSSGPKITNTSTIKFCSFRRILGWGSFKMKTRGICVLLGPIDSICL